jgi:hypothetical protein
LGQVLLYIKNTFANCQVPDVRDNAIAALCKLIMVDTAKVIPLEGVSLILH